MTEIIWLIILVILSAFTSLSETAYTSLNRYKIERMVAHGKRGAHLVEKLKKDEYELLTTILIVNNVINILAAAIATSLAIRTFGSNGVGIATGVMTFVLLLFGEITPKTIAIRHNEAITRFMAVPMLILVRLLFPISLFFSWIAKGISKSLGLFEKGGSHEFTREELTTAIKASAREGSIKKFERDIITNVFQFEETTVKEIMTPRTDMVTINSKKKLSEAIDVIVNSQHARIPVVDRKKEAVVGILYVKDILGNIAQRKLEVPVSRLMREPLFMPEISTIDMALTQFKKKQVQIAIAVDEHGGHSGVVTFEDVVAEIVGDIFDVTDKEEELIVPLNKNTFVVNAKAEFDKVNAKLGLALTPSDDFDTIGGFVLAHLSRIPNQGEDIDFERFVITIKKMSHQRILLLKITRKNIATIATKGTSKPSKRA